MEILAMYDIADPKRLRLVEKTMRRYGYRVQKSVFECSLPTAKIAEMKKAVSEIMDTDADAFRIYPLLDNAREKQQIIGMGDIPAFPSLMLA